MKFGRDKTTLDPRRRFVILTVAVCVLASGAVSGCGVRQGEENIQEARDAKKQVEDVQHKLEKKLQDGQKNLEEGQ
jgi:outer membrane lipoprotein-sorting protein